MTLREHHGVPAWLQALSWLPIPLLLAAMAVLWAMDLRTAHESQVLLMALNLVCSTLAALLVAILAGRSFLVRRAPGILLFGSGALLWGAAGTITAILLAHGINVVITIHNSLVCLSALCFLAGALLSLKPRRVLEMPWMGTTR